MQLVVANRRRCLMAIANVIAVPIAALLLWPQQVAHADSFIGAKITGQIINPDPADMFLWPIQPVLNGAATRWEVFIPYRIDGGFGIPEKNAIISAFNTWNARTGVAFNLKEKAGSANFDFESVMLHEIGHALGLGHPNYEWGGLAEPPVFMFTGNVGSRIAQRELNNAGSIDGLLAFVGKPAADCGRGPDALFGTKDDVALPLPFFGPDDIRHYDDAANVPFDTNCGIAVSRAIPIRERGAIAGGRWREEAVMVQGTFPGEIQRELHPADICSLNQIEARLKDKWVAEGTIDDRDARLCVYQFVLNIGAPEQDCLGLDGVPCTIDDIASPCQAAATCPGGVLGAPCGVNRVLQSNKNKFPIYTIDIFKRGNPADSLALTDNVYDPVGQVNGVAREILGSDILLNSTETNLDLAVIPGPFANGYPIPAPGGAQPRKENDRESSAVDCNQNGVRDSLDIATGAAVDCNGNGIPDSCEEDCNHNGIADLCDLASGFSQDANGNYRPDECDPPNDLCGAAISISNGSTNISNVGSLTDGTNVCSEIGSDIWFQYTATCSRNVTISLCNSNFDTIISVYNGPACPPGSVVTCDDDACGFSGGSSVTFPAVIGQVYKIQIGGYEGAQGTGVLQINCGRPCAGDVAGSHSVNVDDLLAIINHWGPCPPPCPYDIAPPGGNGWVNVDDLLVVISHWGPCP